MPSTTLLRQTPRKTFIALEGAHASCFDEDAVWDCQRLQSGRHVRISGPLAQILFKYPDVYRLTLIAVPIRPQHGKDGTP